MNIRKLFGLCEHKWELLHETKVYYRRSDYLPMGSKYTLQCTKCGKLNITRDY